ncbi:hypothetical protein DRW41_08830 [Neobacillus piezotolerans]|uniref:Uncharacterized protein n=1 Tax=Neobacillus piezotolerans TaxID=2259171 RepID=A0A3D8GTZ0_9BACI|nr:hypothetical protein [Neobacillus piezotolerans]RDU37905.1 hypothetical protein DRW41_08830 [Neobacillus piezotolerans]
MKNGIKLLLLIATAVLLAASGCEVNTGSQVQIKMKTVEEQTEILESYTFEDYKNIYENVLKEASRLEKDEDLLKWVIRTLAQEKLLFNTDLSDKQIRALAKEAMEKDKLWKSIAEDRYGIKASDAEVDRYIEAGPDTSSLPQHIAIAESLNMNLDEYNHGFDWDIYEKAVIWQKLKPKLEKKYNTTNNETLAEKFNAEVEKNYKK